MEKKMDKAIVEQAMNPLDLAFNQISMRKEDKENLAKTVEQVKSNVRHAIVADVASSLADETAVPLEPTTLLVPDENPLDKGKGVRRASAKSLEDNVKAKKVQPVSTGKKLPIKTAVKKAPAKAAAKPIAEKAPVKAASKPELRGTSTVMKPTKLVWSIADEVMKKNPKAKRADILAECNNRGITYYTARTQYQLWKANKAK